MKAYTLALCSIALATTANAAVVSTIDPAGGATVTQSASGTNLISLSAFQTLITTTNDLTLAGVLDAEGIASDANGDFSLDPDYGTLQLGITGTTRYGRDVSNETSGTRGLFVGGTDTLTLTAPTGGLFTHFGIVGTRISTNVTQIIATYSGSGTTTYTFDTAGQTFVGFAAPTGQSITQIELIRGGDGAFTSYDDIAFVTSVPEPSSTALLGLSALGIILRRRR